MSKTSGAIIEELQSYARISFSFSQNVLYVFHLLFLGKQHFVDVTETLYKNKNTDSSLDLLCTF